jgi:hypothetical protein
MSYNIDTWNTKTLDSFSLPIEALENLQDVEVERGENGNISVDGLCEVFELHGTQSGETVTVNSIEMYGEGSGAAFDIIEQAWKRSTGTLIATQVWEGGDSITRLTVKDGIIQVDQIEI